MPDAHPSESPGHNAQGWFPITHWTQVVTAGQQGSSEAAAALEELCRAYWYPLYAYIRRKGFSEEDAKDLAQGFFEHILEKNLFGSADRRKGKFRSFLLGSLHYFLANRHDFLSAKKRGGKATLLSLDEQDPEQRYALEPVDDLTPEKLFDRRWAANLLQQASQKLAQECARQGKETLFQHLQPFLQEETAAGDYGPAAQALGMKPGAVTTAVHRLRQRFAELVDLEIARTVASPEEVTNERQYLFDVLGRN